MVRALILAVLAAVPASTLGQQMVQAVPSPDDPVERLGRFIRALTASPRDLNSLIGAGQAALDVGDPNAALGFFARAEEASPSSGRAKAGLGSALVMIEKPDDALRLFGEAVALGASEASIAHDRGLAYDLRGNTALAQRDYALASASGAGDDELIRRWALSLGIAGNREAAMVKLDPLLRKQDQAAWRARAFVLAMTGDVPAANGVARALMPAAMANAMSPLLAKVATLDAAGRAHAVNFGTVPSDGTRMASAAGDPYLEALTRSPVVASVLRPAEPVGRGLIPQGEPLGPRSPVVQRAPVAPASTARTAPPAVALAPPVAVNIPPSSVAAPPSAPVVVSPAAIPQSERLAEAGPPRPGAMRSPIALPTGPAFEIATPNVVERPVAAAPEAPSRELAGPPPASGAPLVAAMPPTASVPAEAAGNRLEGLLASVTPEDETAVELPSVREVARARVAARKKLAEIAAAETAEREAKAEAAKAAAAAKRNPARTWVQVATGANDSGLKLTWRRLRDANAALKGKTGWSAPFKATNRILTGPLSSAAARELVRTLGKGGLSAMVWNSEAGEEVEQIAQ